MTSFYLDDAENAHLQHALHLPKIFFPSNSVCEMSDSGLNEQKV